jgi:hypothetical protein
VQIREKKKTTRTLKKKEISANARAARRGAEESLYLP